MSENRQSRLISGSYARLLMAHEHGMAEVYEALALLFPKFAGFWQGLAREELGHERIVAEMEEKMRAGRWHFNRPAFQCGKVTESIEWTASLKNRIAVHGISLRDALAQTLRMEDMQIEADFFTILADDCAETTELLGQLQTASQKHRERLAREAGRLRWRIFGRSVVRPVPGAFLVPAQTHDGLKTKVLESQIGIVGMLIGLEEAAAGLYQAYEQAVPQSGDFWASMAGDELRHASMLRGILKLMEEGRVFRNLGAFQPAKLQEDIDSLYDAESMARKGRMSWSAALNTALGVERSMVESRFYGTVESDAPEFRHIAQRLTELTRDHIRKLEQEVASGGSSGKA